MVRETHQEMERAMKQQKGEAMPNIITIYRPELTDKERERRMKQIKEAAAQLIVAADLQRRKHENS